MNEYCVYMGIKPSGEVVHITKIMADQVVRLYGEWEFHKDIGDGQTEVVASFTIANCFGYELLKENHHE